MSLNQRQRNRRRRDRIADIIRGHRRLFQAGIETESEMQDGMHAETAPLRRQDFASRGTEVA